MRLIEEEESTIPIHGDLLEATLSFVPLVHLIPISRVSKSWSRAVSSSLRNFKRIKPWLLVHVQNKFSSQPKTSYAYDPRSDVWIMIDQPSTKYVSTLRSSGSSNFLYMLSSSTLSFSTDPLHLKWTQVDSPETSRVDPIVSLCGKWIIVAGSGWDFEDDTLAVEVYNLESDCATWRRCQSMPLVLKDSASATWLSVTGSGAEIFVTEKASGITYSFDPEAGVWSGPYDLRPDPRVLFSAVGFVGGDLTVVGVMPESIGIWKVERKTMAYCELISVAPMEVFEKLKGEKASLRGVEISAGDNLLYVYNPMEMAEIVYCEFGEGGSCVWGTVRNLMWKEDVRIGGRMVFTCGDVRIQDLQRAIKSGKTNFQALLMERAIYIARALRYLRPRQRNIDDIFSALETKQQVRSFSFDNHRATKKRINAKNVLCHQNSTSSAIKARSIVTCSVSSNHKRT